MNDSGNSYYELIMPSPVRGYNRAFFTGENKETKKIILHLWMPNTRKNVPKLRLFVEKACYSAD